MTARIYHLADHAPVTEKAIEQAEESLWVAASLRPNGIAFDCPQCGVFLEVRTEAT